MLLLNTFKTALKNIRVNKSRSFLTILGIVIGVTSIILIMSIGRGSQSLILNQISGMGSETIVIRPGREPKGPMDAHETLFSDSLKRRDVDALKNKSNAPHIADVVPSIVIPGSVAYGSETFKSVNLGSSAEFLGKMLNFYAEEGILFGEEEIKQNAGIAVIGQKVKTQLFGEDSALGKNIRIKNRNFRVTGVLPSKGQVSLFNMDEIVVVPWSSAQTYLMGTNYYHEIVVRAAKPEYVEETVEDIKRTLRNMHGITDPDKDDFYVTTQEGLVKQIETIMSVLTVFLTSVVAIALVVGGIGVMNIMLVSVTERTREIGLRKAVGATNRNIMTQFLLEAITLTGVGGAISVVLGGILSYGVSLILTNYMKLDWTFSFPISAVFLGLGVSTVVGLVFGIYPARQAAKKSPIEALRYE